MTRLRIEQDRGSRQGRYRCWTGQCAILYNAEQQPPIESLVGVAEMNQRAVRVLQVDDEPSIRTVPSREVVVAVEGSDHAEDAILLAPFRGMCGLASSSH